MPILGLDILGIAMNDGKMLVKEIRPGTAIGVLAGTFGDYRHNLKPLLQTGHVPAVRIHLSNGPCERNKRCERGEPRPTDYAMLTGRIVQFKVLMDQFPSVIPFISPRLEHDVADPRIVKKWFDLIKAFFPRARMVCSAFKGFVPRGPGILVEEHGNEVKADLVSNDGASLWDAPPGYPLAGSSLTLGWIHECNCIAPNSPWIPPTHRHVKLSPAQVHRMSDQMGIAAF